MKVERSRQKWALALRGGTAALLIAALVALLIPGFAARSDEQPVAAEVFLVKPETSDVNLVCAAGIFDEETSPELEVPAAALTAGVANPQALTGGGSAVSLDLAASKHTAALALAAAAEPAALLAAPCAPAGNLLATAGGATVSGEDALLVLSNPSSKPVAVTVSGFTRGGGLGAAPAISVPPGSTVVWRPAVWFPDEETLGLLIEADGTGIAATLQSSAHRGEVPLGTAFLPASAPGETIVIPGLQPALGSFTLQLLNPASDPVEASIDLVSQDGVVPLPGTADLLVEPGVTRLELSLPGDFPVSLVIGSSAGNPLAANVLVTGEGSEDPVVTGEHRGVRQLIGPAEPAEAVPHFPAGQVVEYLESAGVEDITITLTAVTDTSTAEFPIDGSGEVQGEIPPFRAAAWTVRGVSAGGPLFAALPVLPDPASAPPQRVELSP